MVDEFKKNLINDLMDLCWVRVQDGAEDILELKREQDFRYEKIGNAMKDLLDLSTLLEDFIEAAIIREIEKDKLIYEQGAKDIIFLMKRVEILKSTKIEQTKIKKKSSGDKLDFFLYKRHLCSLCAEI